jgi:hypothetical protein
MAGAVVTEMVLSSEQKALPSLREGWLVRFPTLAEGYETERAMHSRHLMMIGKCPLLRPVCWCKVEDVAALDWVSWLVLCDLVIHRPELLVFELMTAFSHRSVPGRVLGYPLLLMLKQSLHLVYLHIIT